MSEVYSIGQKEIDLLRKKVRILENKVYLLDKALRYTINNDMDEDTYFEVQEELDKLEEVL